jgi:hypothetical protein
VCWSNLTEGRTKNQIKDYDKKQAHGKIILFNKRNSSFE